MPAYVAVQLDTRNGETTGRTQHHIAQDLDEAVQQVLYTCRLSDGRAHLGPTGRVVYSGPYAYVVSPETAQV